LIHFYKRWIIKMDELGGDGEGEVLAADSLSHQNLFSIFVLSKIKR